MGVITASISHMIGLSYMISIYITIFQFLSINDAGWMGQSEKVSK